MNSLTRTWLRMEGFPEARRRMFNAAPYALSVWSGIAVFASFEPIRAASLV